MGRAAKPGRKQISLRLPAAMVDRIDEARGVQGRDDFIARILTSALAGEPRQPRRASARRRPAVAPADPLPPVDLMANLRASVDAARSARDLPQARLGTAHSHRTRVAGCHRCELGADEASAYDKALAQLGGSPPGAELAPDTGPSAEVVELARRYAQEHPDIAPEAAEAIAAADLASRLPTGAGVGFLTPAMEQELLDRPWPGDAAITSDEAELAIIAGAQAADPELMDVLLWHLERPVEDPDGPADRLPSPTGGPVAGPAAALEEPIAGLVVPAQRLEAIQTQDAPAMATSSFRSRRTGGITADTVLPPPVHRHKRDSQRVSFVNGRKVIHAKCACGEEWVV